MEHLRDYVKGFQVEVRNLARRRRDLDTKKAQLAELRAAFDAEHADLISGIKADEDTVNQMTDAIKTAAVVEYIETGVKKLHGAVGIRVYKLAKYDADAARVWAQEKRPDLIVLDAKAYEKVPKSAGRDPEMPGKIIEDARATISTDLSAYLDD